MAFIDQGKAFDRVVRAELWKCLAERGIFGELLRAIQSLYICSQAAVRTREGETDWFEVKCGLRQGCVLSPMLFIIFMDNIMKRANQEENNIEELMFADDLVLIAEDQIRLQEMVSNLDQQCKNMPWYDNLKRQDGSDGHKEITHSMWHRIRWGKRLDRLSNSST